MAYTACTTRSLITVATLKEHCRIDGTARDVTLGIILAGVKNMVDEYVKTNFLAADGVTENPIPPALELAILNIAARRVVAPIAGQVGSSQYGGGAMLSEQDIAELGPWWRPAGL